jgi:hypothetical protein
VQSWVRWQALLQLQLVLVLLECLLRVSCCLNLSTQAYAGLMLALMQVLLAEELAAVLLQQQVLHEHHEHCCLHP